jgi:hypothetical protein
MHKIALNAVYAPSVFELHFLHPDDNSFNHSARQHILVPEMRPELDRSMKVDVSDRVSAISNTHAIPHFKEFALSHIATTMKQ